jgi:hypothetical protein
MTNSLTSAAKTIRAELKAEGIKARVSCRNACGKDMINIVPVAYGVLFTEEEQFHIAATVKGMGFTWVRNAEIIPTQYTQGNGFEGLYRSAA